MKIYVASELHGEMGPHGYDVPAGLDFDVAVFAGDIGRGAGAVDWLLGQRALRDRPVLFVAGNHEYCRTILQDAAAEIRDACRGTNVHFLDADALPVIDGVRFVGATLWIDYKFDARDQIAGLWAGMRINDHRFIQTSAGGDFPAPFRPQDAYKRHVAERQWLVDRLAEDHDGPTVVVTHHAPHPRSLHERHDTEGALNASFISDLSGIIEEYQPALWIPSEALGNETVTKRQRQLLRDHLDRDAYMDRVRDEPGIARTVIRTDAAGNATASVPIRFTQSASDRFDKNGRGFVADVAGYYGGSSRQLDGGTCFQKPFVEKGNRSTKSAMTMRVVAMVPKVKSRRRGITDPAVIQRIVDMSETGMAPEAIAADVGETVSRVKGTIHASQNDGRAHSGNNNDTRTVHRRKRVTLDDIHCSLRSDCRELIRVDKDETWETWDDFMVWLHERSLTIDGRQVLPQKVTYVRDDNFPERVTKPHILFILPEKKGVWYNGGTPLAIFNGVAAALTVMYGGDPGGLANIGDIKMPTSPRVVAIDIETEHLPDLSELCRVLHVDLRQTRDRTMRDMSVAELIEAGIDEDKSGALYSLFWKRAWEIAMLWESTRQLIVGRDLDRRKLCADLLDALLADPILFPELDLLDEDERETAEAGLATAAKNVSWKFGRGRHAGSRGYDVGAAESLVAERLTAAAAENPHMTYDQRVKAAQSAGAAYGTAQRNARSVRRIADAMRTISSDGTVPTVALVSALTKIGERTVPRHWDAAVALTAAQQIVSHVLTVPEPVSADAANGSCVWGVTALDSLSEHPVAIPEPAQAVSGETLTLASTLSAPVQRLVDRLAPPIQPSARPSTGRNLLEFVRPGATLYRSALGLREQARRRRKGMRVDAHTVGGQRP